MPGKNSPTVKASTVLAEDKNKMTYRLADDILKDVEAQQARFNGFLGARVIAERAALEYATLEAQDEMELVSGPREPKTFVEIEDIPADCSTGMWDDDEDAFTTFEDRLAKTQRKRGRSAFFARLGESQAEAKAIREQLGKVENRQQLYDLINQAGEFDAATLAWMHDVGQCQEFDLRPLDRLDDMLLPDFEQVETHCATRWTRDQFFARLSESQAEAKAIRAQLSQVENRQQLYDLASRAITFDQATPAWMLDARQCAALDLRPLDCLADKVQGDLEQAEARLAARQRDQFFARLKESQAEARAIRAKLDKVRTAEQLGELVKRVAAFDAATPAWMLDEGQCAAVGLRPLDRLKDKLRSDFTPAEARLRKAAKPVKPVFIPVRMTNRQGGSLIAYSQAYVDRKLREGYRVCNLAA